MNEYMKDRMPGSRPRVYQQVRGSQIWWADAMDGDGRYHCRPLFGLPNAFDQAAKFAVGVFE